LQQRYSVLGSQVPEQNNGDNIAKKLVIYISSLLIKTIKFKQTPSVPMIEITASENPGRRRSQLGKANFAET
jgi:hypothetical protein